MLDIMLTTKFTLKLCSLPSNNKYASSIRYAVPKKLYSNNASTDCYDNP